MGISVSERVAIKRIDVFVYRYPAKRPVATAFGIMRDRSAVFVRIEDNEGGFGWGEIFANWPAAGAEHRANLLMMDVAPLVLGERFNGPGELFEMLEVKTRLCAIQCGELGPFRQVTAGLDIALWDLFARRAGLPLALFLSADAATSVPAYASGIHISDAGMFIASARSAGFRAFKVKVGFDRARDAALTQAVCASLEDGERLFTDANQVWDPATAEAFLNDIEGCAVGWLEEPLPVDAPSDDWLRLAEASPIPLAGGENIAGMEAFESAMALGGLTYIQPDAVKWGGITACFEVAQRALRRDRVYCPHFLGGGIGLAASAHLLAAAGGPGLLEVDVNVNPLRDLIVDTDAAMSKGVFNLASRPGLGIEALPDDLSAYQTLSISQGV